MRSIAATLLLALAIDPAAAPLTAAAYTSMCAASGQCEPEHEDFAPGALAWAWDMTMRHEVVACHGCRP